MSSGVNLAEEIEIEIEKMAHLIHFKDSQALALLFEHFAASDNPCTGLLLPTNQPAMNRSIDPAKKNEQILMDLLKQESNKYCADCGQKGKLLEEENFTPFKCSL